MLAKRTPVHQTIYLLSLAATVAALWMIFFYAPIEINMGAVQKIFYFHVGFAWVGMLSFLVAAIASIGYLISYTEIWDDLAEASIEIGLVFTVIAVISGSIWAKPIWNTWWTWDPRLTTTSIMGLIYFGYLFLRKALENQETKKRFSALYCIAGFVTVPMTFFSIRNARSIHPVVIGDGAGGMNMTSEMGLTMAAAILALTFLYIALMMDRVRLAGLNHLYAHERENLEQAYE